MTETEEYEAIIVGSGQGGTPLAVALAQAGRKTGLIERIHVGGTCINEGCTPTKTMVASAREAYLARRSAEFGVHTGPVSIDLDEVRRRKRAIVRSFREGREQQLRSAGVELIMGEATFGAPRRLLVAPDGAERPAREITADIVVIDTGTRPVIPPLAGLESVPYLDSTSIMELDELPAHLLVLGGGYIGVEFGQMFRRFGSEVTIVQRAPRLMGREDADIADEVAAILRQDGIEILLESSALSIAPGDDGSLLLTIDAPDGKRVLCGSHLLVAVGRRSNTDRLNLEAAGVRQDKRGFVQVNGRLETDVPGIYALGDVAGSPAFTHISYDDFRILRANLLEGGNRSTADRLVPYTMFMDPQLGRVGLGEEEARAQGYRVRVARIPMSQVARALEVGEARGMVKAVVDADTDRILGCAVLGIEGGEIMAMFEIAMMGALPYTALRDGIFAHPTLAELMNTLFTALDESP